jgi:hypothetical protein
MDAAMVAHRAASRRPNRFLAVVMALELTLVLSIAIWFAARGEDLALAYPVLALAIALPLTCIAWIVYSVATRSAVDALAAAASPVVALVLFITPAWIACRFEIGHFGPSHHQFERQLHANSAAFTTLRDLGLHGHGGSESNPASATEVSPEPTQVRLDNAAQSIATSVGALRIARGTRGNCVIIQTFEGTHHHDAYLDRGLLYCTSGGGLTKATLSATTALRVDRLWDLGEGWYSYAR